jgi:ABC-type oligopeptide transport system ATPase subunit
MTAQTKTADEASRARRTLVATDKLTKYFPVRRGLLARTTDAVRAVDGVSIRVRRGETLGLVGESGCGKSTLGRLILRLVEPTFGRVVYDGRDIVPLSQAQLRPLRRKMQIIFQDPYASLNPRMTVRDIVGEAIRIHKLAASKSDEEQKIASLLTKVGLRPEAMRRYPHEFSGGQLRRVALARILLLQPRLLILDEPTSGLDMSVQATVLNLLLDLRQRLGLTYLFISHDLSVVERLSNRVAIMYRGQIVECGATALVFAEPAHAYTRSLLAAAPRLDRRLSGVAAGDAPALTAVSALPLVGRLARELTGGRDRAL